eukprot:8612910-Pyramimonas_sp.AAC.1
MATVFQEPTYRLRAGHHPRCPWRPAAQTRATDGPRMGAEPTDLCDLDCRGRPLRGSCSRQAERATSSAYWAVSLRLALAAR